jgi:hypothetical protein
MPLMFAALKQRYAVYEFELPFVLRVTPSFHFRRRQAFFAHATPFQRRFFFAIFSIRPSPYAADADTLR